MHVITRSALLLSLTACTLPACAVDPSSGGTALAETSATTDRAASLRPELSRCRADLVPTTGTSGCFQPPYPHVPEQLTGFVSGNSDATYATTCSKQATFDAAISPCGATPSWSQNVSFNVASYLNSAKIPASICTASYLDYTVRIEAGTSWYTHASGRVYGRYSNGYCFLGYDGVVFDEGNVTGIEISADSYEVEDFSVPQAPPVVIVTPQGVDFFVGPDGNAQ